MFTRWLIVPCLALLFLTADPVGAKPPLRFGPVPVYGGGYYPTYYSYGNYSPYYYSPYYYTYPPAYYQWTAPSYRYDTYYYPPATLPAARDAVIQVILPAQAELWIGADKMTLTGSARRFVTAPLELGRTYSYDVRARWLEGSQEVQESQTITVKAGDRVTVDLLKARNGSLQRSTLETEQSLPLPR